MIQIPYQYLEIDALFQTTFGRGARSLAICACRPQEGVSSLAHALAKRAATQLKTLLVDLNLFHPSFEKMFNATPIAWSSAAESGNALITVDNSNLNYLPAPIGQEALLILRKPEALQQCLEIWKQEYEAIIFDTSPLLATNYRNIPAELVCSQTDATLLVAMACVTRQSDILAAKEKLSLYQANLLGCVLNDAHNPTLSSELQREINRVNWLPSNIASKLLSFVKNTPLFQLRN